MLMSNVMITHTGNSEKECLRHITEFHTVLPVIFVFVANLHTHKRNTMMHIIVDQNTSNRK